VLCASDGSGCQPEQQVSSTGIARLDGISVPLTGEWLLRVWLEDAAGNVDASRFGTVTLRYGTPAAAATEVGPPSNTTNASPPPVDNSATNPFVAAPPAPMLRRALGLRLTSVRLSRSHLIVRGRLTRGVIVRLTFTVRPQHGRAQHKAVTLRGGPFTLALTRRTPAVVTARFPGNASFRPATAILRTHD
jgi:hypothetical protein